jgi:hypothetical protein
MNPVNQLDRRIAVAFGRLLRDAGARCGCNLHTVCFWTVCVLYTLIWRALTMADHHPEWMWFLLGPGLGTVASYVGDHEPAVLVDDGVALTRIGADGRWSVMRLVYLPLGLWLVAQTALSGEHAAGFIALLTVEVVLFAVLEYLLAIRLVADDDPFVIATKQVQAFFAAAGAASDEEETKGEPEGERHGEDKGEPEAGEPSPEAEA